MRKKILVIIAATAFIVAGSIFVFALGRSVQKARLLKNLKQDVSQQAKSEGFDYSFLVKDLSFLGPQVSFGPDKQFPAASLIKLPILAAGLRAVKEGKAGLDEKFIIEKKDITGGSGRLKNAKLPFQISFQELLAKMTSESDNTAANKVIDILGFDYINQAIKELGLSSTILARKIHDFSLRRKGIENYTSSRDMEKVLNRIYRGTLINRDLSSLALGFLKAQEVDDRLPLYLPENVVIANKTGLERGVVHDAGIVYAPKGNYLICVLTKNTRGYARAKKFIAQVSLLAYNLYKD